jgi:integrase
MNYFWSWCSAIGWTDEPVMPVPAEIVARFVVDHLEGLDEDVERDLVERGVKAGFGVHSMNTIDRRVSALSALHKTRGMPSPVTDPLVSQILSKARKANARRGKRVNKKKAVIKRVLEQLLEQCASDSLIDKRDRALLLFGWASGGRRRSEIADATFDRLEPSDESYVYHMGITKTDQEGEGMTVPVTGRAAAAMAEWLSASGLDKGHLFRAVDRHGNVSKTRLSDKAIALIVKRHAQRAGLNPAIFAGHSLRSGFLTETGLQGKNLLEAMKLSGHKTMQVAAGYHQSGAALLNETASMAG